MAGPITRAINGQSVTIAASDTTSTVVTLGPYAIASIILPAAFTGTALTFTVCDTPDGTFAALDDGEGAAVGITVAQGKAYALPDALAGFPYFKIVSGSSEGAARTIKVILKA